jgi:hypothetical protein
LHGSEYESIFIPINFWVSQLREDIFNRNSSILSGYVPAQLRLFAYKHEFEQRRSLKPESGIDNLGTNPEDALIVMVPDLATIERARREAELASLAAEMESSALTTTTTTTFTAQESS